MLGERGGDSTDRELEKIVRTKAGQEEAADLAIIVLALDLVDIFVAVSSHQGVELLPYGVRRG